MKKLLCIGALITLLISCTGKTETTNVVSANGSQYSVMKGSEADSNDSNISFYGGNELSKIYYFHYYGDVFGKKLSWFLENHKDLQVSAITPCNEGVSGAMSFFVVFNKR